MQKTKLQVIWQVLVGTLAPTPIMVLSIIPYITSLRRLDDSSDGFLHLSSFTLGLGQALTNELQRLGQEAGALSSPRVFLEFRVYLIVDY